MLKKFSKILNPFIFKNNFGNNGKKPFSQPNKTIFTSYIVTFELIKPKQKVFKLFHFIEVMKNAAYSGLPSSVGLSDFFFLKICPFDLVR